MKNQSSYGDPGCVSAATAILGDKWTPKILRALASHGAVRFGELQELAGGINPRTLSARLLSLEQEHIITKTTYAEVPPRSEYNLTEKGADLLPILHSMAMWGEKHAPYQPLLTSENAAASLQ